MNENADWDRLSRYLAGECSDEEERQIDAWLHEDAVNQELLETLRRIWEVSEQPRDGDWPTEAEMRADRERLMQDVRSRRDATSPEPDPDPAPDAHRGAIRIPERLLAPFRHRFTQAVMAAALLLAGVLIAVQMGGETDGPEYRLITTPRGEQTTVQLNDSTTVWLSVDTNLRVPTSFADGKREVTLSGEAYFEVAPDATRPFIVRSGVAQVRVLGTAFGVSAYPADSTVQVVVREGSVALDAASSPSDRSATLQSGQLGVLTGTDRIATRTVDVDAYLSWMKSTLDFNDAPLPEVARRLERWYDVDVQLRGDALTARRLTASFDHASAESVAQIIAATLDVDYRVDDDKIIFTTP